MDGGQKRSVALAVGIALVVILAVYEGLGLWPVFFEPEYLIGTLAILGVTYWLAARRPAETPKTRT